MRTRKNITLILVLGLLLFGFTAASGQTPSRGDQEKKTESCCSMESCCCCGSDSCDMKMKHDAMKPDANVKQKAKNKKAA